MSTNGCSSGDGRSVATRQIGDRCEKTFHCEPLYIFMNFQSDEYEPYSKHYTKKKKLVSIVFFF